MHESLFKFHISISGKKYMDRIGNFVYIVVNAFI